MDTNYKNFPMYEGQPFWFCPMQFVNGGSVRTFIVKKNVPDDSQPFNWNAVGICTYNNVDSSVVFTNKTEDDIDEGAVISSFNQYMQRPEFFVGNINLCPGENSISNNQEAYLMLLVGCALIRAHKNNSHMDPDAVLPKVYQCTHWLEMTDFFSAPASSHYHEAFVGGLCYHTLKVVNNVYGLWGAFMPGSDINVEDAVLVALVHDWCKIGLYESYTKNVKNDETGTWEKQAAFRRKSEFYVPLGHGVSSYFLASRFFRLSLEEIAAIRWHMGRWNVSDEEVNEFQQANETFPMVHLIQFADQLSITKYK